jgi:hypothetical protein
LTLDGRTAGLHRSSCPNLILKGTASKTRRARRQFSSLPSRAQRLGNVEVRTKQAHARLREAEIRSSPVYAGHIIKPLKKFSISSQAPAVSDRIEAIRQAGGPRRTLKPCDDELSLPSEATQADLFKRNGLPHVWLSECEHGRASKTGPSGARLFSGSRRHCQEQNSGRFRGSLEKFLAPNSWPQILGRKFLTPDVTGDQPHSPRMQEVPCGDG